MTFVKRPKYSNRSTFCWQKHWHQSVLEADYCNELSLLKKSGEIADYTIQHKIEISVNGVHITNHIVDFLVKRNKKDLEFHEVKGMPTEVWKIKRKLVEAILPGIPYIVKTAKPKYFVRARFK